MPNLSNMARLPLKIRRKLKSVIKANSIALFSETTARTSGLKNSSTKNKIFFLKKLVKLHGGEDLVVELLKDNEVNISVKIVNSKAKTVYQMEQNGILRLGGLPDGKYFLAIKLNPNTNIKLTKLKFGSEKPKNYNTENLKLTNRRLMVVPDYPSNENKYNCAFLHTRAKIYREAGLDIDLLVVNGTENKYEAYTYDGILVNKVSYGQLREILHTKKYEQILIHFFNEFYAQILDAVDTSETEIFLYSHGADLLYWDYPVYGRRYFEPKFELTEDMIKRNHEMDSIVKRYNKMPNVNFVFVCEWSKKRCEKLLGEKINRSIIIPCLVDERVFKYKKRTKEQRKKICLIRSFHNLNSYSIDTDIRVILELSRRPFFKDLEFSIYGAGEMHEILVKPIKQFKNIKI